MSKINEQLTLVANLAVVIGIVFLAVEVRQNTQSVRAQTRSSLTEQQMQFAEWVATNPQTADVMARGTQGLEAADFSRAENFTYFMLVQGHLREWENSLYQYEQGLFTAEDFEARMSAWTFMMNYPGYRDAWAIIRTRYSPAFRSTIDEIVAEMEGEGGN